MICGSPGNKSPIDLQEQVPRRAFELHELRENEDEHHLDDWLQGESELVQQQNKACN
jgi:hypothetical protein